MTELLEMIEEAEEKGYVNEGGKALPYLGWFWRDISTYTAISQHNGQLWVNTPRKWDYPSISPFETEEDVEEFEAELKQVLEKVLDEGFSQDHAVEFQKILRKWWRGK
jgi:hypothetical protein